MLQMSGTTKGPKKLKALGALIGSPPTMPTLYDVAHFCSWNGYAEDMRSYLGVDKAAWTNEEFWFPYGVNVLYGSLRKSRLQILCQKSYGEKLMTRVKKLLEVSAKPDISDAEGKTALMVCCHFGNDKMTKILLAAGADPNKACSDGWTPLHYTVIGVNIDIAKELIDQLVNAGANINVKNIHDATPIGIAIAEGKLTLVKYLVSKAAVISENDTYMAITCGNLPLVKYLVSQGAEITDDMFETLIKKGYTEILIYFKKLGLRAPLMSIFQALEYKQYKLIGLLAKMGASVNGMGDDIPLVDAIDESDYDAMRELCKAGADVNILHPLYNTTPIYSAIMKQDVKAVKILYEYKVDLNKLSNDKTPLHYSIMLASAHRGEHAYIDCVKEIIKCGPDFSLLNKWGETAAEYAAGEGSHFNDIVILIKRAEMKVRLSKKGH
jgi:ankyrin repeat protein